MRNPRPFITVDLKKYRAWLQQSDEDGLDLCLLAWMAEGLRGTVDAKHLKQFPSIVAVKEE